MGKDKLEHNIKNKLSSYESAVNTDALWAGISAGMAAPAASTIATTGSSFLKTWGLGIFVAAAIGIGAISYYAVSSTDEMNTDSSMNSSIPTVNTDANENKTVVQTENLVSKDATVVLEPSVTNTKNSSKSTSQVDSKTLTEVNKTSTASKGNTATATNTLSTSTNSNTSSNVTTTSSTLPTSSFGSQSNTPSTQLPATTETKAKQSTPVSQPLGSTQKEKETTLNFAIDQKASSTTTIEKAADVASTTQSLSAISKTAENSVNSSFLEKSLLAGLSNNSEIALMDLNLPDKITCPSFGGNSNSGGVFMAELQGIPYYSIPRITALNEAGEEWKQTKLDSESYLETFQVNLLARYQMNNGLYFNAGVGYGQLDEKLNFMASTTIVTQEELPVTIIIRPDGMNDTIPGQVEVTQDSMYVAETFNYHRMVEFTAGLGYEIPVNSRLSIYGDVGVSINILTSRTGWHVLDNIDVVMFDNTSRPVYTTSTGYKLTGGLGLRYYLDNGVFLSGGPEFRSHLSNWIRDEHPIELRYIDVGVRMAVGYMF